MQCCFFLFPLFKDLHKIEFILLAAYLFLIYINKLGNVYSHAFWFFDKPWNGIHQTMMLCIYNIIFTYLHMVVFTLFLLEEVE